MTEGRDDRSLGELFGELARETSTLVRQELRLAGAEATERVSTVGKDLAILVAGAVIIHAGLLALVAAIIIGLWDLGIPGWLSALIVALVLAAGGYGLVHWARTALQRADIMPRRTMDHLREDREWIEEQVG